MAERPAPPSHESRPLDLDMRIMASRIVRPVTRSSAKEPVLILGEIDLSVGLRARRPRAFARQVGANLALSFVMWCIRSSDATARPSSWWSLLPLPHRVQRNTVGTRWSRGRCWKGMNRGRKNLTIQSGRRSFAVRGDGSCKGETRHSVIDMNVRRMKGKILPACRFYGEGNC